MTIRPLPAVLQEIAGVVGEINALIIASKKGGVRVWIPASAEDDHWLVQAIGREAADKLCAHFQFQGRGQRIDIPLHVGGTYRQLVHEIARLIHEADDGDASSRDVASKAGVTQRTVHRHRARHSGNEKTLRDKDGRPRQGKLF